MIYTKLGNAYVPTYFIAEKQLSHTKNYMHMVTCMVASSV